MACAMATHVTLSLGALFLICSIVVPAIENGDERNRDEHHSGRRAALHSAVTRFPTARPTAKPTKTPTHKANEADNIVS